MKHWALGIALVCFGSTAANAAQETFELYNSSCTVNRVYVGSVTATSPTRMDPDALDVSTGSAASPVNPNILMGNRKYIKIENQDRNSIPYRCDFSSANMPASEITWGTLIASSGTLSFPIPSRDQDGTHLHIWCRSMGALVSTAAVTQCGSR